MFLTFIKNFFLYLRYIRFNYFFFKSNKSEKNRRVVLVEFNGFKSFHVSASLLTKVLSDKFKASIIAYPENTFYKYLDRDFIIRKIFYFLGKKIRIKTFGIYSSFGVQDFIEINRKFINRKKYNSISKKYFNNLKSKDELLKFRIKNILYGDLIYDSYLKYYKLPTLDLDDKRFYNFFLKSIEYYFFWESFFKIHDVCGVVGSQAVYLSSLPMRMAASLNKISIVADPQRLYSLNSKRLYSYKEYLDFDKILRSGSILKKQLNEGKKEAKKRLKLRFLGKIGIDINYLSKSAYNSKFNKRIIKNNNNIKILVAPHSFYDAPHTLGNHLFSDYFEWLNFIFKISKETNYDWYIKCHPRFHDDNDRTIDIIKNLCVEYKNFQYIDHAISHNQLISEGINYVITCNGTIGLEYPYLGVPAINASKNNPHYYYKFNYHPESKKELKEIILNIQNKKIIINKSQILEYYFLKHIYFSNDWLFDNFQDLMKYCGGYKDINKSYRVYDYFLKNNDVNILNDKIKSIKLFIESSDYLFNYTHKTISYDSHFLKQKKIY